MKVVDFSNNLNTLRQSESFSTLLKDNIKDLYSYPKVEDKKTIGAIAEYYNIPRESIVLGNGSTEIIFNLPRSLPKGNVMIINPTFWEYSVSNQRVKENKILYFKLEKENNFVFNVEEFEKEIKKKSPATVYICNPNNPTSTLIDKKILVKMIKKFSKIVFVVDETYLFFRNDFKNITLAKESTKFDNLYVVSSFSKFFAVPGLRCGYAISSKENIKNYKNFKTPYLNNPLVKIAIPHLLNNTKYIDSSRNFFESKRKSYFKIFKKKFKSKMRIYYPEANFLLCEIITSINSSELTEKMKKDGILIRDARIYEGLNNKWVRFCIREDELNDKLVNSFDKYL